MAEETKNYVDFKRGTQAEYDALAAKNADTLYFITDNGKIYLGEKLVADSLKGVASGELVDKKLTLTFEDGTSLEIDLSGILTLGTADDEDKIVIIDAAGNVTISDVKLSDVTTDIANLKALHEVIEWGADSDANDYIETGMYHFAGYRLNANDNLPMTNSGDKANVAFTLVVDKHEGKFENNSHIQTVIGQTLLLSNRQGSETKIYTRHAQQSVAGQNIGEITWEPWSEVVTSRTLMVNNIDSDLNDVTEIGLYTGVNQSNGDVFKLEVVNNYAVADAQGIPNTVLQTMTVVGLDGSYKELQRTKLPTGEWTAWSQVTDEDKQDLVAGAVENNVATFDANGQVKDSGVKAGEAQFGGDAYKCLKTDESGVTYYTTVQDFAIPVGTTVYSDAACTISAGTVSEDHTSNKYSIALNSGDTVRATSYDYNKPSDKTLATEAGVVDYVTNYVDPKVENLQSQIDNLSQDSEAELAKKADKVTGATADNLAGLDANGNLQDSGYAAGSDTLGNGEKVLATEKAVSDAIDAITISVADGDKVLATDATGKVLSSTLTLDYDSDAKKIYLKGIGDAEIDSIDTTDFVVDGMLEKAELGYCKIVDGVHVDAQEGEEGAVPCIKLTFNTDAKKEVIHIELSKLVDVYTAGLGLEADANNKYQFNVKIDGQSEGFLTVSADGIKLSGVQDAIDAAAEAVKTAVDAYTVNGKAISENPVLGSEDIARPAAEGETAKTVEETLVELEGAAADVDGKITDAINALDAEVTSTDGTNVNVKVTQVDGVVTAVNVTDNTQGAIDTAKGEAIAEANAYTDEKVEAARLVWGSIA